jgi:DNA-binding IclR family transcriptional regulator
LEQAKKIIKSNKVVDLINLLYKYPVINASTVTALTSIPSATATRYLNALVESKILYPNDMVRNRTFYYYNLLDIIR